MQKSINPFLFEAEEPPQHLVYEQAAAVASNPFLMDFVATSAPEQQYIPENPFLTQTMGSMAMQEPAPVYSNPFADVVDTSYMQQQPAAMWSAPAPQPPTASADMYASYGTVGAAMPPSTHTQDLLAAVTGSLDATSDSLLDRLRVSQPSPIPQPPSPTPSPRTPSPVTPDLLGGFDDEVGIQKPGVTEEAPRIPEAVPVVSAKPEPAPHRPSVDIMDLYQTTATTFTPTPAPQPQVTQVSAAVAPVVPQSAPPPVPAPAPVMMETTPVTQAEVVQESPEEEAKPAPVPMPAPAPAPVFAPAPAAEIVSPPERPKPPVPVAPAPAKPPPPVTPSRPPPPAVVRPPPPQVAEPPKVPNDIKQAPAPAPAPKVSEAYSAPPPAPAPAKPPAPIVEEMPRVAVTKPVNPAQSRLLATTFDSFDKQFETFGDSKVEETQSQAAAADAWGDESAASSSFGDSGGGGGGFGFDADDSFLAITEPPPVPQSTPSKYPYEQGEDYGDGEDTTMTVVIRPKGEYDSGFGMTAPALAPPPKSPAISTASALSEDSQPFVPFLSAGRVEREDATQAFGDSAAKAEKRDSLESPGTPLYEEDTSQPLEDFPRTVCEKMDWEMFMRHPNKKKITGQRFWKKVFVRLVFHNDVPILQISNNKTDKDPIQEIPLQPCYSVSDIAAQQFDQYGKIFTAKVQYIFYKERAGIRPGQISKAERISTKLSQFAAFAIQGDYQGVKEFGSDLKKLGIPIEHAPQISQLVKLGTQNFEEMKQFSMCIEEALFHLPVHRDRALTYKTEEIQVTVVDEYYVEQDVYGVVLKQIARVRLFLLSFLSGNIEIELGINDMRRQGKEVVGRHDIVPIATEEWIRTEAMEFASCVQMDEFERTKMIKFKPPDACYIELLRFRVRPPRHRELPLQVKTVFTTTGHRIEVRCDILVPGFTSRKLGQIPCEDVMVRIPIPETWIYMFRVEKHFRYGSVKSAHRRSGKVKGIERFLGAVEAVENSLMEVTSGQAKYEHQHRAIVWRVSRLPKDGQGAYTTHSFFCHITLQPHEEIPDNLTKYCYVEFTMPHTTVSHTVCRSISVPMCDEPPEKCVRNLSRHEYVVEVEHTTGVAPASYNLAATVEKEKEPEKEKVNIMPAEAFDEKKESDSDFSD